MALFTIIGRDAPNTLEMRLAARAEHLARLKVLDSQNRLVLAGPCPIDHDDLSKGFSGSVLVVDFNDAKDLDDWLKEEPYVIAGVYASVEVIPFKRVLPEAMLAWD